MSKILACPHCGSTHLRSDEAAIIGYSVVLRRTPNGAVDVEYTGESYDAFDEGTEYSADVWCRNCGEQIDEDDLVEVDA